MYAVQDPYILDFSKADSILKVHQVIKAGLDFPNFYGCNLDALWDCLTEMVGGNVYIALENFDAVEQKFGEYAENLLETFRDFKHVSGDKYCGQITIEVVNKKARYKIK